MVVGKWNETLAETGMSLIPSLELPIGLPSWGPTPPPPSTGEFPKPTFTCNDKPAWWGGRFPCLGSFEMELEFEHPGIKGGDPFTIEIESKCKGFWSGAPAYSGLFWYEGRGSWRFWKQDSKH